MTEGLRLVAAERGDSPLPGMIGSDAAMLDVYRLVRQVAPLEVPVMIVGETGTGKELVAQSLHELSPRRAKPFVAVNAAALPEPVFESELFGHERGAFSDAKTEKAGLLETAGGGTFYLDELGALPAVSQAKLLRVVEEGKVLRIGGVTWRAAAPRWLASCQTLNNGRGAGVRRDLWYRLSGEVIGLPPLRDRRGDIPVLVRYFLNQVAQADLGIETRALDFLTSAPWPGNVRELRNVVRRLASTTNGCGITREAVRRILSGHRDPRMSRLRQEWTAALAARGWNVRDTAHALGIPLSTFYRRLRLLGISIKENRPLSLLSENLREE